MVRRARRLSPTRAAVTVRAHGRRSSQMTDKLDDLDPATVEALRSLSFRYAAGVDRRDLDRFLSSFHADATLTVQGATGDSPPRPPMRGHAEIGKVVERIG